MGKLAEAYVEVGSKTQGFDDGLSKAEKSLQSFVGRASSILGAVGIGVTAGAAVASMARFLGESAKAASDLNEAINKTQVTFGGASGKVVGFAQDMADKFGLVKSTTLDAAAGLGLIIQKAGYTESAAAELSTKLVKLAADAGSLFNTPFDVALEKMKSGLVGEAEPLRAFGVLLSEDAVKAAAYAAGIAQVGAELTDQQKVAARAIVIQQDLAKASGDLDRTIGDLANAQRRLNGDLENFKAKIGEDVDSVLLETIKLAYDTGDAFAAAFDTKPLDAFKASLAAIKDELTGFRIIMKGIANGGDFRGAAESLMFEQLGKAMGGVGSDLFGGGVKGKPAAGAGGAAGERATKKFLFGGEAGHPDPTGFMGLLSPFGALSPLGMAAMRTEPRRYDASSQKMDAASFGADAIMRSLEGSQSPMAKQLDEQKRANEHLKDILDTLKRPNERPGQRAGVFPRRGR